MERCGLSLIMSSVDSKCVKVISDSGMKRKLEMMTGGREKTK